MIGLKRILIVFVLLVLVACNNNQSVVKATTVVAGSTPTDTPIPTASATPTTALSVTLTPNPSLTPTPEVSGNAGSLKCIHMGSFSIDYENLEPDQVDAAVKAVEDYMPGYNCIAIGLYLDYDNEVRVWIEKIHKYNFLAYIRSAGFNTWQGTNETQSSGTPEEHVQRVSEWIERNYDVFKDGDVFEPVDEASNGKYWFSKYGSSGVGSTEESKAEFNLFIQSLIDQSRQKFDAHGKNKVIVEVYHDNPSVIKNVLSSETITRLVWVGTNSYPACPETSDPTTCAGVWQQEIADWGVPGTIPWHITFGYTYEHDSAKQARWLEKVIPFITNQDNIPNLAGITVWQFGEPGNVFSSALFSYESDMWIPHAASIGALNKLKLSR